MDWLSRKSYGLFFYSCFLAFLVVRFFDQLFLFQVSTNPIRSPRVDLIVWITHYIGIPDIISNSYFSLFIDLLIVLLPIIILYRLYSGLKIHKLAAVLSVLFAFYILIIYCFPTLSIRKYLGLVLIPIAFIFTSEKRYYHYLELMRYYLLFVFTSASLWKLVRGVAWDPTHMQLSLKAQHIDNFINWPDHFITRLISSFVDNPTLCTLIFIAATLSQFSFIIGFFTKKYDRLLAILLVIFIISDYLVMRIEYWEFIVFLPLLLGKYPKSSNIESPIN